MEQTTTNPQTTAKPEQQPELDVQTKRLQNPQTFYQELTKRVDIREILERLAKL